MGWLRQTLTVGANPNVMLPFFTCAGYSPQQCSSKHIFVLETALLLDSWRIDPVFGTGTGWTFCYIQMAWQLRDNNLFWMYVFFLFWGMLDVVVFTKKSTILHQWFDGFERNGQGVIFQWVIQKARSIPPVRTEKASSWNTVPGNFTVCFSNIFFQRCTTESVMRLY